MMHFVDELRAKKQGRKLVKLRGETRESRRAAPQGLRQTSNAEGVNPRGDISGFRSSSFDFRHFAIAELRYWAAGWDEPSYRDSLIV